MLTTAIEHNTASDMEHRMKFMKGRIGIWKKTNERKEERKEERKKVVITHTENMHEYMYECVYV